MFSERDYALMVKGFLQAMQAPQEMMLFINSIIAGSSKEKLDDSNIENKAPTESKSILDNRPRNSSLSPLGGSALKPKEEPDSKPDFNPKRDNKWSATGLSSEKHLEAIQKAHDEGESNASIGKRYNVSDQSIVNFLKKYGKYTSKANVKLLDKPPMGNLKFPPPPPPPREVIQEVKSTKPIVKKSNDLKKTDILGEPLVDIPFAPAPSKQKNKSVSSDKKPFNYSGGIRVSGQDFSPGDLVDIHDMLSTGMTTEEIGVFYKKTKKEVEDFVLKHKNVQITKCEPGLNPTLVKNKVPYLI